MKFPRPANKMKNGVSTTFPDVCRVPAPPAPFAPTPYPNVTTASGGLSNASRKVKVLQREVISAKTGAAAGNEAGTQRNVVSTMNTMSSLFQQHAMKVKAEGKKASLLTDLQQSNRAYDNAAKIQRDFEKKLEQQSKKLLDACKDDPNQLKAAKKAIDQMAKAARGHSI